LQYSGESMNVKLEVTQKKKNKNISVGATTQTPKP